MRDSHSEFSIKDIYLLNVKKPHYETRLRPAFLPLEKHNARSLAFIMKREGGSQKLIRDALHLFKGIQACQQYAKHYAGLTGRERQAQAYQLSAHELEARLRLLLYDAFPPDHRPTIQKATKIPFPK